MRRFSRIPQAGSLEENWFSAIYVSDAAAFHSQIEFDTTNALSTPVPANVSVLRLFATENCFVSYGENPTAANKMFLPAGIIEYYGVDAGKQIAVTRATKSGILYVTYGDYL